MGNVENLNNREAIDKLKKLAEDIRICMFCSAGSKDVLLDTRPMSVQKVEDDGSMWFFSSVSSNKNQELRKDEHAQLIFSDPKNIRFMTLYGTVKEVHEQTKIDELWNPMVKAWFKEGKEDPDLTLLHFITEEGYYWEPQHNKMVAFLKIAASSVTGKSKDDGVEGLLNV